MLNIMTSGTSHVFIDKDGRKYCSIKVLCHAGTLIEKHKSFKVKNLGGYVLIEEPLNPLFRTYTTEPDWTPRTGMIGVHNHQKLEEDRAVYNDILLKKIKANLKILL